MGGSVRISGEFMDAQRSELTFASSSGRGKVFLIIFPSPLCLTGSVSTCALLISLSTSLTHAVWWCNFSAFDVVACCLLAFSWATTALEWCGLGQLTRPGLIIKWVVCAEGCIVKTGNQRWVVEPIGGKAGEVWLLGLVMCLQFIPEDPPSLFVTLWMWNDSLIGSSPNPRWMATLMSFSKPAFFGSLLLLQLPVCCYKTMIICNSAK